MALGAGDRIRLAGLDDGQAAGKPGLPGRPQLIGVEAYSVVARAADPSCIIPAITQIDGDGAVGMARHNPDRCPHLSALDMQLDDVGPVTPMLAAMGIAAQTDPELLRRRRA